MCVCTGDVTWCDRCTALVADRELPLGGRMRGGPHECPKGRTARPGRSFADSAPLMSRLGRRRRREWARVGYPCVGPCQGPGWRVQSKVLTGPPFPVTSKDNDTTVPITGPHGRRWRSKSPPASRNDNARANDRRSFRRIDVSTAAANMCRLPRRASSASPKRTQQLQEPQKMTELQASSSNIPEPN